MPKVIEQLNTYMDKSTANSEVEANALQFYLLNQAFGNLSIAVDSKAELTPEQEHLATMYLNRASESSARLFYYILLIITREARHLHSSETLYKKLIANYGSDVVEFHKTLKGAGSDSAVQKLRQGSNKLANVTLGQYASCVTDIFNQGSFSGGYGGKPWGKIADTLRKMVFGETSIEIMNDTAWTLAHNNGPMFNKGMLYKGYSPIIYKILDVQRAGMIPQLIAEGGLGSHANYAVSQAFEAVKAVFPESVTGYVDWFKVEDLGSLHKYPSEKLAQTAKYGKTKATVEVEKKEASKFWVNENEYAVIQDYKRAA
jgi:hypothetical protein